MDEVDLQRIRNFALSLEAAIVEDYLIFECSPFIMKSLVQTVNVGIQTAPDIIRAGLEPMSTAASEIGDLTNLIG